MLIRQRYSPYSYPRFRAEAGTVLLLFLDAHKKPLPYKSFVVRPRNLKHPFAIAEHIITTNRFGFALLQYPSAQAVLFSAEDKRSRSYPYTIHPGNPIDEIIFRPNSFL